MNEFSESLSSGSRAQVGVALNRDHHARDRVGRRRELLLQCRAEASDVDLAGSGESDVVAEGAQAPARRIEMGNHRQFEPRAARRRAGGQFEFDGAGIALQCRRPIDSLGCDRTAGERAERRSAADRALEAHGEPRWRVFQRQAQPDRRGTRGRQHNLRGPRSAGSGLPRQVGERERTIGGRHDAGKTEGEPVALIAQKRTGPARLRRCLGRNAFRRSGQRQRDAAHVTALREPEPGRRLGLVRDCGPVLGRRHGHLREDRRDRRGGDDDRDSPSADAHGRRRARPGAALTAHRSSIRRRRGRGLHAPTPETPLRTCAGASPGAPARAGARR